MLLQKSGPARAEESRGGFDVIAMKNGIIYNVQCKNNLVDFPRMEKNPKMFARYNKRLDRYYADALRKEEQRRTAKTAVWL